MELQNELGEEEMISLMELGGWKVEKQENNFFGRYKVRQPIANPRNVRFLNYQYNSIHHAFDNFVRAQERKYK